MKALRGFAAALAACFALGGLPAAAQEGWELGPGVRLSHHGADFEMHLNSYVQGDVRSRRNFTDGDDEEEGLNGTDAFLQRARFGLEGKWKRLSFEGTFDPADEG